MSKNLDIAAWLCINYNYQEGNVVKLDNIFNNSVQFFEQQSICPPSKDIIARLVPYLYGAEMCFVYEKKKRYAAYRNLAERKVEETSNIAFPSHSIIENTICINKTVQFKIPLPVVIDGQIQYCVIDFKSDKVMLQLKNSTFHVSFDVPIKQQSVDGIIHMISMIKVCEGVDSIDNESSVFDIHHLSLLHDENSTKRKTWSKSCSVILNWTTKKNCCDTCTCNIRQNRKRKCTPDISQCVPSKTFALQTQNTQTNIDGSVTEKQMKSDCHPKDSITLSKEDHDDMQNILSRVLENGAPEKFKILLHSQLQNCKKCLEIHQRRWDPQLISVCLDIFLRSPRAYEDLNSSGLLLLPSKRLLQYYKNSVRQTTCFNQENLTWMQKEAQKQDISDFGLHGGIVIDEMSLQDDLVISRKGDSWDLVGIADMGTINNNVDILCNGEKKVRLATHALQFVFHGLTGFRWPVAYFGSCTANAHQIYTTFWKCVDELDERGFTVDYMMADGASTNRSFTNMLFNENPRVQQFQFKDIYHAKHSMCAVQDIMHVLKKIRNNLESSRLENRTQKGRYLILDDRSIVWDHWMECYNFNFQNGFGIHSKLTEEHFILTPDSKMRNQLAIDVLDKNMLFLMKTYQATLHDPERLASSIQVLENTSVLTDIFGNTNQPIFSLSDERFTCLTNTLSFFNTWEQQVIDSVLTIKETNLITQETRDDINSAIAGFISLCKLMLGKGGNSINPGFFNSDLIENLFGQQRGIRNGLNTNPTLAQYGPSNTAIILGQCSVSNKCNSGKSATYYKATTLCALNRTRNKCNKKTRRKIRM